MYNMYMYNLYIYTPGFPYWGDGGSPPHQPKICSCPPPSHLPTEFLFPPHQKSIQPNKKSKNIFSCSHCSCTNFVLILCSFETQVMLLILILIYVQYSQNAVVRFEKFSNRQNHSSSSHHLVKKSPQQCSLLFDTNSGKLLKFQVKKNSNFILKPRQ